MADFGRVGPTRIIYGDTGNINASNVHLRLYAGFPNHNPTDLSNVIGQLTYNAQVNFIDYGGIVDNISWIKVYVVNGQNAGFEGYVAEQYITWHSPY